MTADIEDYGGLDWGSQNHRACLVDRAGKVVGEYDVSHTGGRPSFSRALRAGEGGLAKRGRMRENCAKPMIGNGLRPAGSQRGCGPAQYPLRQ